MVSTDLRGDAHSRPSTLLSLGPGYSMEQEPGISSRKFHEPRAEGGPSGLPWHPESTALFYLLKQLMATLKHVMLSLHWRIKLMT